MGTNRITSEEGGHLFNDERVFVLEVAVEQIVYVFGALRAEQISSIVESGFGRGDGGRIKFRSLLQENQGFNTLVNVEVLQQLSSPLQEETHIPTTSPTDPAFTLQPSSSMTSPLSDMPSFVPSTAPPPSSFAPYLSEAPEYFNSEMPTENAGQPFVSVSTSHDPQPLILGAIAGGLATIVVSGFFIVCVWFPFCRNKRYRDGDSRNKHSGPTEVNSSNRDTAIPETLHLDDDSRSLANTTVTLGEKSTKKPSMAKGMNLFSSDSFDETSIYTSTLPGTSPDSGRVHCSTKRHVIDTVEEANEFEIIDQVSDDDRSAHNSSSWNDIVGRDEFREDSRSTKGLDVFSEDEESSYEFGSSIALSDPSFGPAGDIEREYRPTPSPSSTKTRRIMNLMSQRSTYVADTDEEMKSETTEDKGDFRSQTRLSSNLSLQTADNNTLLRTILESARDQHKIGSSKTSLKSAPPRIHEIRQRSVGPRNDQFSKQPKRLDDHLHRTQTHGRLPPKSTRSVGTYSKPIDYSLYKSTASLSGKLSVASYQSQSSGTRRAANPYFHDSSVDREAFKTAMVSPSSSDSLYGQFETAGRRKGDAPGVLGIASIATAEDNEEPFSVHSGANSAWSVRSAHSEGTFSTDGSQSTSYASSKELATAAKSKISALEYDLERIGQLSSFSRDDMAAFSIASAGGSRATYPERSTSTHNHRKQRVIVVAPPGKIGVVLINRHDGRGTVVSEVRNNSAVKGLLYTGDKLGTSSCVGTR